MSDGSYWDDWYCAVRFTGTIRVFRVTLQPIAKLLLMTELGAAVSHVGVLKNPVTLNRFK